MCPSATHSEETQSAFHPGNAFDSLTLKALGDEKFHASITHTDMAGKLQRHEYEGTKEEIRRLIEADDDLLINERFHLLRSLRVRGKLNPYFLFPGEEWFDF